jgi:hypothetical protein
MSRHGMVRLLARISGSLSTHVCLGHFQRTCVWVTFNARVSGSLSKVAACHGWSRFNANPTALICLLRSYASTAWRHLIVSPWPRSKSWCKHAPHTSCMPCVVTSLSSSSSTAPTSHPRTCLPSSAGDEQKPHLRDHFNSFSCIHSREYSMYMEPSRIR